MSGDELWADSRDAPCADCGDSPCFCLDASIGEALCDVCARERQDARTYGGLIGDPNDGANDPGGGKARRVCERTECGKPLPDGWVAVYCSTACARRDA